MMFNTGSAKREARQLLRGSSPSPILVTMTYLLLTSAVSMVVGWFLNDPIAVAMNYVAQGYEPMEVFAYVFGGAGAVLAVFVSILLKIYTTVVSCGYNSYTLNLVQKRPAGYADLFDGFGIVMKVVLTTLLSSIFVALWSMLFVIPGIMAAFSYSQAIYCLLDDPDISPLEAIRRSKELMRGEKFHYFLVEMSFFGWVFLAGGISALVAMPFSADLALADTVSSLVAMVFDLFLMPYKWTVMARFYTCLRDRQMGTSGPRVEF